MKIIINDIQYQATPVIRDLTTVVEVKFNNIALIIRDPLKLISVNGAAISYETLRQVWEGLTDESTTEFEYKS